MEQAKRVWTRGKASTILGRGRFDGRAALATRGSIDLESSTSLLVRFGTTATHCMIQKLGKNGLFRNQQGWGQVLLLSEAGLVDVPKILS